MTIEERKTELENCSFCKAALMILIVLYHVVLPWEGGGWANIRTEIEAPLLRYFAIWMNSFHIYGFVLISGYICFLQIRER